MKKKTNEVDMKLIIVYVLLGVLVIVTSFYTGYLVGGAVCHP